LEKIINFPDQIAEAYEYLKHFMRHYQVETPSKIVVLGMGGSGIVGDFVRVILRNSKVPVHVCKSSVAPRYVDKDTLVIAITYSGNTKETTDALNACISYGAAIVVITSSPELQSICKQLMLTCILVSGNGHTRCSFGYLLLSVLSILQSAGIVAAGMIDQDILESVEMLKKVRNDCSPDREILNNQAMMLALALKDRFPIIYGESNFTDAIAQRWKQLLNENSKTQCQCEIFPELVHNEVEAWANDGSSSKNYPLILLRDVVYEREVGWHEKFEVTKSLIESKNAEIYELWTSGISELARLLSLSYVGDFVSIYLAFAKGIDPSYIPNIEFVKKFGNVGVPVQ
jgi:glucose/mannose-6-phosphate isomerase